MTKEPLFKVASFAHEGSFVNAILNIDGDNDIFKGHFPDQPVVPGACMLQIVKDTMAGALNSSIRLVKADNIKFLSLVQPSTGALQLQISYLLTDNDIKLNATLTANESVCMKLQATFVKVRI
jgi:3-hydroxyacyl-[acyl-carrier-protein] dehydratase